MEQDKNLFEDCASVAAREMKRPVDERTRGNLTVALSFGTVELTPEDRKKLSRLIPLCLQCNIEHPEHPGEFLPGGLGGRDGPWCSAEPSEDELIGLYELMSVNGMHQMVAKRYVRMWTPAECEQRKHHLFRWAMRAAEHSDYRAATIMLLAIEEYYDLSSIPEHDLYRWACKAAEQEDHGTAALVYLLVVRWRTPVRRLLSAEFAEALANVVVYVHQRNGILVAEEVAFLLGVIYHRVSRRSFERVFEAYEDIMRRFKRFEREQHQKDRKRMLEKLKQHLAESRESG